MQIFTHKEKQKHDVLDVRFAVYSHAFF